MTLSFGAPVREVAQVGVGVVVLVVVVGEGGFVAAGDSEEGDDEEDRAEDHRGLRDAAHVQGDHEAVTRAIPPAVKATMAASIGYCARRS